MRRGEGWGPSEKCHEVSCGGESTDLRGPKEVLMWACARARLGYLSPVLSGVRQTSPEDRPDSWGHNNSFGSVDFRSPQFCLCICVEESGIKFVLLFTKFLCTSGGLVWFFHHTILVSVGYMF